MSDEEYGNRLKPTKQSSFYLTEVKLPPSASSSFYHDLDVSEAYRECSPLKKTRTSVARERRESADGYSYPSRRGAIFCDVFEDDASGNNVFYEINTPRASAKHTTDREDFGITETCRQRYLKACRELKIRPSTTLIKQLKDCREIINLRGMNLGPKYLNAFCAALIEHTNIRRLDLGGNNIKGKMVSYIAQLIQQNSIITELILTENHLSGEGVSNVAEMLRKENCIKLLDLSGNRLTDKDAIYVADIMRSNPNMVTLKLNHNQFRIQGGKYIGDALSTNDSLDKLDLSWNHLRQEGAVAIAMGLMKNKRLTLLDISWNGFGFEGCVAMCHALTNNRTLHHLNMESNRIHPPALFELTKGLVRNTGLHTLKIGTNPITAICTTPFMSAIKDSDDCVLTVIDLSGVVVDEGFEDILTECLDLRPIQVYYERCLPVTKDRWKEMQLGRKTQVFNIDPIQILFHLKKNLRNIDLFRMMDRDNSSSLSRDEIAEILRKSGYPVSSRGMDEIMDYLDIDGDGEVDLAEFISGERQFKRRTILSKESLHANDATQQKSRENTTLLELPDGMSKFSSTYRSEVITEGLNAGTTPAQLDPPRSNVTKLPKI